MARSQHSCNNQPDQRTPEFVEHANYNALLVPAGLHSATPMVGRNPAYEFMS